MLEGMEDELDVGVLVDLVARIAPHHSLSRSAFSDGEPANREAVRREREREREGEGRDHERGIAVIKSQTRKRRQLARHEAVKLL